MKKNPIKKQVEQGSVLQHLGCGLDVHERLYNFLCATKDSKEKMYEDLRNADRFEDYLRYLRTALDIARYETQQTYSSYTPDVEKHRMYERRFTTIDGFFNGFVMYLVLASKTEPALLEQLDGPLSALRTLQLVKDLYVPEQFTEKNKEALAFKLFLLAKARNTTYAEYKEVMRLLALIKHATAVRLYGLLPGVRKLRDLFDG